MPDSRLIPAARFGWLGHVTYGNVKHPGTQTVAELAVQLMRSGKQPDFDIVDIANQRVIGHRTKEQFFDGYKFEQDIKLDDSLTINNQVLVLVAPTHEHPDLKTPIVLPDNWILDFNTTFNGLEFDFGVPCLYKLKTFNDREYYFCEYLRKGKRFQFKGSLQNLQNFIQTHRTVPIAITTIEKLKAEMSELWHVTKTGSVINQIVGYKKKKTV